MSQSFSAVLLAGGKSSRMGRDKALIELDGRPLWQRQLQILRKLGPAEIFIAGPARTEWKDTSCLTIADARENCGPLGGLVAALRRCSTSLIVAFAVDLPGMTADYLSKLLSACSEGRGAIPRLRDRFEPLAAVYPVVALPLAEDALESGDYSLQKFAARCLSEKLLQVRQILPGEEPLFLNLNTAEDFAALREEFSHKDQKVSQRESTLTREPRAIDVLFTPRRETRPTTRAGTNAASQLITLLRFEAGAGAETRTDHVAAEEPLEIRIEGHSIAVVMRTPGHDRELAAGFLLTENLIRSASDIFEITLCGGTDDANVVNVTLRDPTTFDAAKLTRHVFSSSSCGICSKATIDAVRQSFPAVHDDCQIAAETLLHLPARLRGKQETFAQTGGLHACALFDLLGHLQALREDVGRHNALDKLIGHALLENRLPLRGQVLLLSGRVSFEMMQKALAAGIPIVAAISAPTSLAVEFARASNQTLIGFLRGETLNVYAGAQRVAGPVS